MPASRLGTVIMRYRVMLLGLAVPVMVLAQSPEQDLPRFRAGANLVRVDAYVSKDDVALTDLTADDFSLFEDDRPQQIENFELVHGAPAESAVRAPRSDQRARHGAAGDRCRAAVHAVLRSLERPAVRFLPRAQADHRDARPGDRPGRSGRRDDAGDVALARSPTAAAPASIERAVTDTWHWGERDSLRIHAARRCDPQLLFERQRPRLAGEDDCAPARGGTLRRARRAGRAPRSAAARDASS